MVLLLLADQRILIPFASPVAAMAASCIRGESRGLRNDQGYSKTAIPLGRPAIFGLDLLAEQGSGFAKPWEGCDGTLGWVCRAMSPERTSRSS